MRALRATVDGSHAGWKFNLSDWAKIKFKGVRYVDQDGILIDEGQVGRVESGVDYTSVGVEPLSTTTEMAWDGEQEPIANRKFGIGFEEVAMGNRHPTQAVEFFPVDFFADPSVLFSGPSSTGFTGIDDRCITGEDTTYLFRSL